jgi:hypothetical protein
MVRFLKTKVWPIVAGFIVASIVMVFCEWINSFFFPVPKDIDWSDAKAVRALTSALPWNAYILVIAGYIIGSFKGGYVTTYLAGDKEYSTALVLGLILTLAGYANVLMLGHMVLFSVVALPQFLIFTYLGHRYLIYAREKKMTQQEV